MDCSLFPTFYLSRAEKRCLCIFSIDHGNGNSSNDKKVITGLLSRSAGHISRCSLLAFLRADSDVWFGGVDGGRTLPFQMLTIDSFDEFAAYSAEP